MVCRHVKSYLFRDVDGVSRVFFGNVTNAIDARIDARIEKAIRDFNLKAKFNYRVRKNTYEVAILGSYFNLGSIPDEVRATVTISPEGITVRDVQFISKYVDENDKEEESGMKTLTIHNVEATLYFWNGCKLAYINNDVYERRIKERCESLGYDKKPLDKYNYSNQFGEGVRFIVNDYTGPTIPDIPDERYVKMDCDVIIKDTDGISGINIKCNQIIHAYSECKEEETDMLKKETNKEYFARARAAARRYAEYRQHRDQMRAPGIIDIKFNGPATIIFWDDGTKTVVKQYHGEAVYDKEKAIAMALIKKIYPPQGYHMLFHLDEYFGKQLRAAEKKRDSILSQIKDARKPKVTARLEQELYKIDDEIARLKKEVEKFE